MSFRMHAIGTISLVAAVSSLACTASTGAPEDTENVGQSNDALSVYQWSNDSTVGGDAFAGASIATYNYGGQDHTVMVHSGDDRGNVDIYWAVSDDGVSWSSDHKIDAMASRNPAQIAAFNGYVYMLHTGENDNQVWMSRFDGSTWSHDFMLPYTSSSTPALASYNGALYIVGSTPGTGHLWQATMSTSETFSGTTEIAGAIFVGTPSLTVHCASTFCFPATLFVAYSGPNNAVMMSGLQATYSRRGVNTTWWTPWVVQNADGSVKQTTTPPAIASYGGMLHMLRTVPAQADAIKWTYYDGSNWSYDVSIGDQRMYVPSESRYGDTAYNPSASLAARADKLVMVHLSSTEGHDNTWGNSNTAVYGEFFQ